MRSFRMLLFLALVPGLLNARSFSDLYALVQGIERMNAIPGVHASPKFSVRDENEHPLSSLEISIKALDGPIVIAITPDGHLSRALDPKFMSENPAVELLTDGEPIHGSVEIAIDFAVELEPSQRLSQADYRAMLSRYEQAKNTQGFFTRHSMPKAKGISLRFATPCGAIAELDEERGRTAFACDAHGEIRIPSDVALAATRDIEISEPPNKIELAF